ncbi:MAG: histidine phosphatase family protein [Lautropia sp.]|nr:histidine phosphatase family protein [Lautropia sp.]
MSLKLYLARHGRTVFNVMRRIQGWCDSPLTDEGRAVAAALGASLGDTVQFDAAYASTSPRAIDTARLILRAKGQGSLPIGTLSDLREFYFGGLEGELIDTVYEQSAAFHGISDLQHWLHRHRHGSRNLLIQSTHALDPLGLAETEQCFIERIQRGLDTVVQQSRPGGTVLLVSHGMAISTILKKIAPDTALRKSIRNATPVHLSYRDGRWSILDREIPYD